MVIYWILMVIQAIQGPSPVRFKEKSMTLRRSDLSHSNLHLKIHRVLVLGLVWYRKEFGGPKF